MLRLFLIGFISAVFHFGLYQAFAEDQLPLSGRSEKVLTIAADEWCPVNCKPDSAREGIGVDLARVAFAPMGYRVNYVTMPWSRALDEANKGSIDAVVGANDTDDPHLIFPKEPILEVFDTFYVLKGHDFTFDGIQSLKGHRLGIIRDYGYNDELTHHIEREKDTPGMIQEVSGETALQQNIKKLQSGRIDVLVESQAIMNYMLQKLDLQDDIIAVGSMSQGPVFLGFSPVKRRSTELAEAFDRHIAELRKTDQLLHYYEPYNLTP